MQLPTVMLLLNLSELEKAYILIILYIYKSLKSQEHLHSKLIADVMR